MSKTICDYATDNYIVSYAQQIKVVKYPEESEKMKLLVDRLLHWYEVELPKIQKDEYIRSKESHIKSYTLLKELGSLIKEKL